MPLFSSGRLEALPNSGGVPLFSPAAMANRRRRVVFGLTLLLACVASLAFVFLRPAEYQAIARLQITLPAGADVAVERKDEANVLFLTEVQVLTSRPLVEKLLAEMQNRKLAAPGDGSDPAGEIQRALVAVPLPGTTIVELKMVGPQAQILAPMLNTLYEVYRDQLADAYSRRTGVTSEQTHEEAGSLAARIQERRRAIDEFRARHNIVSLEREENQVLAQAKGQGTSVTAAKDKLYAAEAKLRSLRESIAAGKAVVRAKDNPTLSSLEQRYSQTREELRDMERSFTEAYLNFDPKAKSLRIRLANLEEQIKQTREAGQQTALHEAEEEVASARATLDRLNQQIAGDRSAVQTFTARLAEYKAMQEELSRLEAMHAATVERSAGIESSRKGRAPTVRLLEPASTPQSAWRPLYGRDAAIAVAGSLLLALLVVWVAEFFNRSDAQPAIMMGRAWMPVPQGPERPPPLAAVMPGLLPGVASLPRELDDAEVGALLDAAVTEARPALTALLSGLQVEDILDLHGRDIDLDARQIRLSGRMLPLGEPLASLLGAAVAEPDAPVFRKADGSGSTAEELEANVAFAAHDARLIQAEEVNAAALRHTYIAYLVRQGARFGDLGRLVGRLPAEAMAAYSPLAPSGAKRPIEEIDPVLPALRQPDQTR
jgi:uncharacterized protein involved in exopolysaccharide biosynthesis